jgi:hypothetical protein
VAIYVLVVIIFFLTIPEIVVRVLTPEQFARLSDFTSFGGLFSHLLSLLIFLGLASILLGVLAILATKKNLPAFSLATKANHKTDPQGGRRGEVKPVVLCIIQWGLDWKRAS